MTSNNKSNNKNISFNDSLFSNIFNELREFKAVNVSMKIASTYGIVSILWVLLTDKMVQYLVINKNTAAFVSIIKGFIYVLINSVLLFFLIYSVLKKVQSSENKLIESYDALEKAHEKSVYNSNHDSLTDFPNRLKLREDINKFSQKNKDAIGAVLVVDIDNFKYINDVFGNGFGDKIIIEIGKKLSFLLKDGSSIYKVEDDEFIILIENFDFIKEVEYLAEKIISSMKRSIDINGNKVVITVSIGISIYTASLKNSDELIKKAYIALYSAKKNGKNRFSIFDNFVNEKLKKRMKIQKNILEGLNNKEFYINYQPQYNVLDGKISGFEALSRWKNKEIGFVSPEDFIEVAEETNLIVPLGKTVLENACKFIKNINAEFNKNYTICVNISILQIAQNDFVNMVSEVLKNAQLDNELLELEITESVMMESYENISCKIEELRSRGIKIALDDFGKGYSSFSCLKQLPITTLKIDKSFIDNIVFDTKSNYIVGAMISISKKLGISVVAEGVETKEQYDCLAKYQCDKIQGYYLSRPIDESDVRKII
ncbi:MAG: bifunctional diguanylate cyclase/phosphodiesterase [Clostridium sp.]|nr:bifunctional diguanylate cyclase/phosphodiesterase [Clostridium sp.]